MTENDPDWVFIPKSEGVRYFFTKGKHLTISSKVSTSKTLVIITGLSGSGKSTLGPKLADYLNAEYLDEDSFYNDPSTFPKVDYVDPKTGNVQKVRLWDHESCINFEKMNSVIDEKFITSRVVVLSGFYLPLSKVQKESRELIYINLAIDTPTSLARRAISKSILCSPRTFDRKRDEWMVTNYVTKFHLSSLPTPDQVNIHTIDARVSAQNVCDRVLEIFL